MAGWIKLHRKITENLIWEDKPFSKGQAWIDLILMANHNPAKLIYGNSIIELDRGQFHTSEPTLMRRWGWSKKKVRAYFLLLKKLEMATAQGNTKGTTVTIENYELYQSMGTEQDTDEDNLKVPRRNRKGTAEGKQTRTKEEQEEKEPKEEKNKYSDLPVELQKALNDFIEMRTKIKKPITDSGIEKVLAKLEKLSNGDTEIKVKILDESVIGGWQGVFPLKEEKNENKRTSAGNEKPTSADDGKIYDYEKFFS